MLFSSQQCVGKSSGLPVLCPCHPDPSPAGLQVQEITPDVQVIPFQTLPRSPGSPVPCAPSPAVRDPLSNLIPLSELLSPLPSSLLMELQNPRKVWAGGTLELLQWHPLPWEGPSLAQGAPSPCPPGLAESLCCPWGGWAEFLPGERDPCVQLLLHGQQSPVSSPSLRWCLLWAVNVGGHRPGTDNQTISQEKCVYLSSLLGFPTALTTGHQM